MDDKAAGTDPPISHYTHARRFTERRRRRRDEKWIKRFLKRKEGDVHMLLLVLICLHL
jgi:hypothetical protein